MKLGVTADLHASDYGRRIDPASGLNARFVEAVELVGWIARDAQARGCDALIVAGDITEERHPAPWRVALIADALRDFGGPVVLVRGNHDGLRAGRSIVDVLASSLPDGRGFSRPGVTHVGSTAICALPYLDRHWLRAQPGFESVPDADVYRVLGEQALAIARGLYAEAGPRGPEVMSIVLVVHQALAGGRMSDSQQAFLGDLSLVLDTRALAAIGFDAVLAGHFHRQQTLQRDPLVAYAGSPHRVDFGEAQDPKGYLVVTMSGASAGAACHVIETPCRRFVTVDWAAEDWDRVLYFGDVEGAIVRVLDVDPGVPASEVVATLEAAGAWDITEVRHARVEAEAPAGMDESLSAGAALEAYFAGDDDAEALIGRGREILAEVAP